MTRTPYGSEDSLLKEVTEKLYVQPYVAAPRSDFVSAEDAPYKWLLLIQKQQELIQQQTAQLEANDIQLKEQQTMIKEKAKAAIRSSERNWWTCWTKKRKIEL